MKNNFLYNTRKCYCKVRRLNMINAIKSQGSFYYDTRLRSMRKIIIKWFDKNSHSILMLDMDKTKVIYKTLEYGRHNDLTVLLDEDRQHIYDLVEAFNDICYEIEEYYG